MDFLFTAQAVRIITEVGNENEQASAHIYLFNDVVLD
jgi:hypothetical protein